MTLNHCYSLKIQVKVKSREKIVNENWIEIGYECVQITKVTLPRFMGKIILATVTWPMLLQKKWTYERRLNINGYRQIRVPNGKETSIKKGMCAYKCIQTYSRNWLNCKVYMYRKIHVVQNFEPQKRPAPASYLGVAPPVQSMLKWDPTGISEHEALPGCGPKFCIVQIQAFVQPVLKEGYTKSGSEFH